MGPELSVTLTGAAAAAAAGAAAGVLCRICTFD
jgi:hypothetical protein